MDINYKPEQDWWLLCESTPFTWKRITYSSPTHYEARVSITVARVLHHRPHIWTNHWFSVVRDGSPLIPPHSSTSNDSGFGPTPPPVQSDSSSLQRWLSSEQCSPAPTSSASVTSPSRRDHEKSLSQLFRCLLHCLGASRGCLLLIRGGPPGE